MVADEGCACPDKACLERAHRALADLEAKHGGLDDLPPNAYAAHARFERCYLVGTKDLVRDLDLATRRFCACSDTTCATAARSEILGLEESIAMRCLGPRTRKPWRS